MNKFEQVNSDGHQISVAGGFSCSISEGSLGVPISHVWRGPGWGGVKTVRSNASWAMVTWEPSRQNDRQTDMTATITFPQLCWRAVTKKKRFLFPTPCCFCTKPIVIVTFQLIPRWQHSALVGSCTSDKCTTKDNIRQGFKYSKGHLPSFISNSNFHL